MKNAILLSTVFAATALADACNHDNVLRCLIGSSAVASPYCSSYISIPVVTVTISTYTPLTTTTAIASLTETDSATSTSVSLTTTTTTTYVAQVPAPTPKKRSINESLARIQFPPGITARAPAPSTSPAPKCITQSSSSSYPASRISSACSCLSVSTSTTTVTATAPSSTITLSASTTAFTVTTTLLTITTSTSTSVVAIPTGAFQIKASAPGSPVDGVLLNGIIGDGFWTGFNLPYGEYILTFNIDPATGYVAASAPGKESGTFLHVYTSTTIPAVITAHLNVESAFVPLSCTVGIDAVGYPLTCTEGLFTKPTLLNINGDGQPELGLGRPDQTGPGGDVKLYAVFL